MASQQVDSSTHPENHNVESELAPPIRVRYVAEINSTGVWIDSPSPTPLRKRKLPIWLNPVQGDLKKCKAEPDAEQKRQVGSSNPGPNTSQNCDITIKKEIKEEPQDGPSNGIILQPCIPTVKTEIVVKEEATSSIRDSCEFGIRCYKKTNRAKQKNMGTAYGIYNSSRSTQRGKRNRINKKRQKYFQIMNSQIMLQIEDLICRWIAEMWPIGFSITKEQLTQSMRTLALDLERLNPAKITIPGDFWCENFLNRNPEISSLLTKDFTNSRCVATEWSIRDWFDRTNLYLRNNNFIDVLGDPDRIFNCNETAFFLNSTGKEVLYHKRSNARSKLNNITLLITTCASGRLVPPLVVYPSKRRVSPQILSNIPNGWGIGKSGSGWVNCASFYEYITDSFYPWIVNSNVQLPVIIFLDGHTSYLSVSLHKFCQQKGIILMPLLPTVTYRLEPLDTGILKFIEATWTRMLAEWRMNHKSEKLPQEYFAPLINACLFSSMNKERIVKGFEACGLFPFNPNAIGSPIVLPESSMQVEQTIEKTKNLQTLLSQFESRLPESKLKKFKESLDTWTGPLKDKALFYYWKCLNEDTTIFID